MLDWQYLTRISHRLEKFQKVGRDCYRCRCPLCGDSQKDPNKCRGNFYPDRDDPRKVSYKCYNCGAKRSFRWLLKVLDADIYKSYLVESLRQSGVTGVAPRENVLSPDFWKVEKEDRAQSRAVIALPENFFEPVTALHHTHPAKAYLDSRRIPERGMARLYYTDRWKAVAREFHPEMYPDDAKDEPRIVIPIMHPDGSHFVGYQGRSLDPNAKVRYKMIMTEAGASRIFGQEMIDKSLPVIAVEGPIDSLFLDNCVALCGATNTERLPFHPHYLLDQEPRNAQVVSRMGRLLELGESVCFLEDRYQYSDVNEIVIQTGKSPGEMTRMVLAGSLSGQRGLLKLAQWKRTDDAGSGRKGGGRVAGNDPMVADRIPHLQAHVRAGDGGR